MHYDNTDFLEHFDTKKIDTVNDGLYEYSISDSKSTLIVMLAPKANKVYIKMVGVAEFEVYNIEAIRCEKKYDVIKFIFYKKNREYPFITLFIYPFISVSLDLEQTGFC